MKTGIELIAEERQRQVSGENFRAEHDDQHSDGELADAGAYYALTDGARKIVDECDIPVWPFEDNWLKIVPGNSNGRVRNLVKAGALIAAEIDRLQRAASRKEPA